MIGAQKPVANVPRSSQIAEYRQHMAAAEQGSFKMTAPYLLRAAEIAQQNGFDAKDVEMPVRLLIRGAIHEEASPRTQRKVLGGTLHELMQRFNVGPDVLEAEAKNAIEEMLFYRRHRNAARLARKFLEPARAEATAKEIRWLRELERAKPKDDVSWYDDNYDAVHTALHYSPYVAGGVFLIGVMVVLPTFFGEAGGLADVVIGLAAIFGAYWVIASR